MKFIFSQMAFFVAQQSNKRNLRFMLRFFVFVLVLICVYSALFHYIMLFEGRSYSPVTGLYWTLTVMSTLGFGDITFTGDLGKVFSVVVLLSGIVLFMLVMPFTFIRYVYSPWLEAHSKAMLPRELPESASGHVVLVGTRSIAMHMTAVLQRYNLPYVILSDNYQEAMTLFDSGLHVLWGELDSSETYLRLRAGKAALIVALHDDLKNTNIASTAREAAPGAMIAGIVEDVDSVDILHLAGCNYTFNFAQMLGEAIGRRVFGTTTRSNIVGRFGELCVAESAAHGTALVGKTLRELDLRGRLGLNVAGIWQGNEFLAAQPDIAIDDGAVILLAGSADLLELYDQKMLAYAKETHEHAALVLGGGQVGRAVAKTLETRGIPFSLVEKNPAAVPQDDPRYITGSAADIETLRRAGIDSINTVIVTTHDDDLNIYLTIYCRKLRPDAQIISRATLDRNVASLYNAGANLVLSHSGLAANALVNLITPGRIFMLTEGLNIFRVATPDKLVGVSLAESGIRNFTECNVVAIRRDGVMEVNPDPGKPLGAGGELVLIGTAEAEQKFIRRFMPA